MTPEEKKEYNHKRYLRRREKALEYAKSHFDIEENRQKQRAHNMRKFMEDCGDNYYM